MLTTNQAISDNEWHHVLFSRRSSNILLQVDNKTNTELTRQSQSKNSRRKTATSNIPLFSASTISIGSLYFAQGEYLTTYRGYLQKLKYNGNYLLETCFSNIKLTNQKASTPALSSVLEDAATTVSNPLTSVASAGGTVGAGAQICKVGASLSIAAPINLKGTITVFNSQKFLNITLSKALGKKKSKRVDLTKLMDMPRNNDISFAISFYIKTANQSGLIFSFMTDLTIPKRSEIKSIDALERAKKQISNLPFIDTRMIAVELYRGYLNYIWRYNAENEPKIIQFNKFRVNDNRWHRVVIKRTINNQHSIYVDQQVTQAPNELMNDPDPARQKRIIDKFIYDTLSGSRTSLFIGGINAMTRPNIVGITSERGFTGCLSNFKVNKNVVRMQDQFKNNANPNIGARGCKNLQCQKTTCSNGGKCVSTLTGTLCNCKETPFEGDTCTQHTDPAGQLPKDYIKTTTTTPIDQAKVNDQIANTLVIIGCIGVVSIILLILLYLIFKYTTGTKYMEQDDLPKGVQPGRIKSEDKQQKQSTSGGSSRRSKDNDSTPKRTAYTAGQPVSPARQPSANSLHKKAVFQPATPRTPAGGPSAMPGNQHFSSTMDRLPVSNSGGSYGGGGNLSHTLPNSSSRHSNQFGAPSAELSYSISGTVPYGGGQYVAPDQPASTLDTGTMYRSGSAKTGTSSGGTMRRNQEFFV